jgi:hypothetical protein
MKDWGRSQTSLTSWLIVMQISLNVFTGHDYLIGQLPAMGYSPHCATAVQLLTSLTNQQKEMIEK